MQSIPSKAQSLLEALANSAMMNTTLLVGKWRELTSRICMPMLTK